MKRKLLLLLVALLPMIASAYDAQIDGIYYDFSGDNATVTYQEKYNSDYSGEVVIPESVAYNGKAYSVTSIGEWAFYDCTNLTSITIPSSVTSIGGLAFQGCTSLTSITIPNSVTSIGEWAFSDCNNLTSITIPNSVTSIGRGALSNCTSLTSIQVETGNTTYDSRDNCNAIIETATNTLIAGCKNTTIPNSVTSIGGEAFYGCSGLTSITIPNSVTSIGGDAFRDCTRLTSITIPNSVTSIGESAFQGCSSLTSVTIPNSVTSIGGYAFSDCSSLTSITIPNSVTSIGEWTFSSCSSLTSITIPNSVTSIGGLAFQGCTSLTSITIPNSVTSIGSSAFLNCSSLTSITIPNSVTSIGRGAFSRCKGLTSIQVETGNTTYDSRDNCNAIIETATNTLIAGCKNTTIPGSVTSIGGSAFSGCSGLTSVTIPNSVTSIGSSAFLGCTSLTSITIPNSVTSIGERAFSYCSGLTAITIGTGIKDIGSKAFAYCEGLTDVYCFAENVPNTNTNAFSDSSIGSATLHVPASSISSYSTTEPWSEFGKIVSSSMTYTLTYMIDGQVYKTYSLEYGATITPEPEPTKEGYTFSGWSEIPTTMPDHDVTVTGTFTKDILGTCATPTISYANGELKFNSETEGVTFHYSLDIADDNIKNGISDKVQLSVTYHISVYATREDYYDSEVATGTLCWIDQQPSTEGIVAEDAVTEIKALPVLIQAQAGFITVQGLEAGTEVSAYNTSGMLLDTIISSQDTATLRTKLPAGSTAIVKIGQRAVKIMVK